MVALAQAKAAARKAGYARRKMAHAVEGDVTDHLLAVLADLPGETVSGYWPILTEVDPRPALMALHPDRKIVLPVVDGPGQPLSFRFWTPEAAMIVGDFGAAIPVHKSGADPDILIVPLVAFDALGYRLGYGGGFYDRTLERLRSMRPTVAIGLAYAGQRAEVLPVEPTDQPLDMIVTQQGVLRFTR